MIRFWRSCQLHTCGSAMAANMPYTCSHRFSMSTRYYSFAGRLVNIALHSHRHFRALAEPEALPKPKHVIFGTADGFTSCRTTTLFFDNCNKEIRQQSNVTPTRPIYRVELIGVGNAGHFWHTSNHLALMMKEVREFVQSCVLIEHSFEAFALVP